MAQVVIGPGPGGNPEVLLIEPSGTRTAPIFAPAFLGGASVTLGDVNGDGTVDIIAGAGLGGGPHVRVFSGTDLSELASFYAFDPSFSGGVHVASGDVNGDGRADIIVGAGAGAGPHVRVFSGLDLSELASFYAFPTAFTGGVTVAAGDVDGDGLADIVTGAGAGGGPHVRVFSGADLRELASFYAYDADFAGGVSVAAGDFNGDGLSDIVTGAGPGGGPHVRVFSGVDLGELVGFYGYDPVFGGGANVATGDIDGDGRVDLILGAGPGGGPHVRILSGVDFSELASFYAPPGMGSGISVGSVGDLPGLRFTSAAATTFTAGTAGTFTVTTAGNPAPIITSSGALPAGVTVVDNGDGTATLAGTPAAGTGGTYPLTFTADSGSGMPATQSFTLTVTESGAPTLSSVSPNLGLRGTTVSVTLTGAGFVAGATTVAVAGGGVTVTTVDVSSGTSLTANFVLDPAAAEGSRSVTVTTTAGTSGAQFFTVTVPLPPGTPTLTSVSPSQGVRGSTVAVTLTGTNFVAGATTVSVGGSGVTVTNVTVSSGTSLTANFVLDPTAADGFRTVTVTTAAGTSGPRIFAITLPAPGPPTLTSVTPNEGIQGTTVAVTLTGTNFIVGATTVNVSGSGVTVNNVVVGGGTSLTASFVLDPTAADGPRSVTVATAAGTSGAQTFTIDLPPPPGTPTLTSVSPNQGVRGTTVAVMLTGTVFVVGATTVNVSGAGVTVTNVVVGSPTSLTASFVLDPAAAEGPRTVTVTTARGTSAPQVFTITPPPPTLTSVSPNQGLRGATVAVTLTGTNFVVGATTVAVAGGGVTATNVAVGSSTSLTASFVLDLAAAAGPRTVTVATADGTTGPQTFTITLPPPGSTLFNFTGGPQTFTVPAGVVAITIDATGASGGRGGAGGLLDPPGMGGRTTATVSVVPGALLTVRVGGVGPDAIIDSSTAGGFNGGGGSTGDGGGAGVPRACVMAASRW